MSDPPGLPRRVTASAETVAVGRRDALGTLFFWLHVAIMAYIVTGWLLPGRVTLTFYLVFIPAVAVQWWFNRNSCILNNLESVLRHGQWRDARNVEEGAWLLNLVRSTLGLAIRPLHMEVFTYAALALLWSLGFLHLRGL